ncbi:MAG: ABC transporter substrate-binding protein [Nevskiales bacterium]
MRGRTWWRMGVVVAGLACGIVPAVAQKSADTLRVTWRDAIPNVDFYYNSLRNGYIIQIHAQDGLVYRDPDTFQIKPLLATSWKPVDDTTIDFELRQGVTFQNGDRFSADDVVYTINSLLNDKDLSVPSNYLFLAGTEKLDDYHVRLKLKRVFPAALQYIAMVLPIYPKAYREKVGPDGFSKAPIGTGPYKITKVDGVTEIDMERNDAYFADSPKGKPAIRFIRIHEVADAATEMAELLGGRADWIWDFSPDQFDSVAAMPTLTALRAETMRVAYLQIDAAGRTGAGNPLTKPKVRQAIAYALDRTTMAHQLMQGNSRPLDAPCFPTQFGCDQAAAVHYGYDPAKAKQLLAEAGYPNGFDTDLVTYLLPQWNGAIQGYLQAVGVRAHINQLQVSAVIQQVQAGKTPLNAGSWGSYSINDVSAFFPYFFTGSPNDYMRNPQVEKLVADGGSVTDPDQRRKAYSEAIRLITEQAAFVPLFTYVKTYGFSRQLNFKGYPDELPRFYLSSWK